MIKNKCTEDTIFKNNFIGQLNSSWFSNSLACSLHSGKFSWDVLGYILDKPSPISHIEPDFILWSLRILGFHACLQDGQVSTVEIKCKRLTRHLSFATSAAKTISLTAFCYDRRSFKYHFTSLTTMAAWMTPHHTATALLRTKVNF